MSEPVVQAVTAVMSRLATLVFDDPELRKRLRQLAQVVLDATEITTPTGEPQDSSAAVSQPADGAVIPTVVRQRDAVSQVVKSTTSAAALEPSAHLVPLKVAAVPSPAADREPICDLESPDAAECLADAGPPPELTLGRMTQRVAPPPIYQPTDDATISLDFARVASNCRLKAEAARRTGKGPAAFSPRSNEERAGCFEALADALSLVEFLNNEPKYDSDAFTKSLNLLAEAQSAVRAAVGKRAPTSDNDQVQVFNWLRETASERSIFIQHHMRADDPADPSKWANLAKRIKAIRPQAQNSKQPNKKCRKLLGKVRYQLGLMVEPLQSSEDYWKRVAETINELLSHGLLPSNVELRDLLLPVIDNMPDLQNIPKGFRLVLREMDRYLASCPAPKVLLVTPPTPELMQAAQLLNRRTIVLIGGDRRPASYEALRAAFNLDELFWISTREHQSIAGFEPYIARSEVAVVLLAIRWASHSFR